MTNTMLWQQVAAFRLDEVENALPFSQRLAHENGWHPAYAARVIEEYRRFLYLAASAPHPVTPSDAVDQAWHLHLVYTRSYWEDLCGGVLGKPLHHGPTKGGSEESQKFHDWYARTLDSYRREFGTEPPLDIWPEIKVRFAPGQHFQRVNLSDYCLVPRRFLKPAIIAAACLAFIGVSVGFWPRAEGVRLASPGWLLGILVLLILVRIVMNFGKGPPRPRNRHRSSSDSSGCSGLSCGTWHSGHHHSDSGCGSHGGESGSDGSSCGSDGGSSGCSSSCGGGCGGGGD